MKDLAIADEDAMLTLGRRLGRAAAGERGLCVYLEGSLGAGKSTLARGWIAGMGHAGRVKSPTYTLLEPYQLPDGTELAHMDLYRLVDPEELEFLGLRELSGSGRWLLVEWPEKGGVHLPPADLRVVIGFDGGGRRVALTANTAAGADWLADKACALLE